MNRLRLYEVAKRLPPTGKIGFLSQSSKKLILRYTFNEIPAAEIDKELNLIPWDVLDKNNINVEKPDHVFKMLYKYNYDFLANLFVKNVFEKQIKTSIIWKNRILEHKYNDLKRQCVLKKKPKISLFFATNQSQREYGVQYDMSEMPIETFKVYYLQNPVFKETVDIYNRTNVRKSGFWRSIRGMKITDKNLPEGYYNV